MINMCIPKQYMNVANDISRAQSYSSIKDWAEAEVLAIIRENLKDYGYKSDGSELNSEE